VPPTFLENLGTFLIMDVQVNLKKSLSVCKLLLNNVLETELNNLRVKSVAFSWYLVCF
jgi:hypothetical protein